MILISKVDDGKTDTAKITGRDLPAEMAAQIATSISQKRLELEKFKKRIGFGWTITKTAL
jgi:hypothetical protein